MVIGDGFFRFLAGTALCTLLLHASPSPAASFEAERVAFPALKDFEGRQIELDAHLYRPQGPGPFPALVLLHGCSGMYTRRGELTHSYRHWAELLAARGYVALLVDSFGPRGQRSICDQQKRAILESRERVEDAYAALRWLNDRPFVARGRIGLLGWSNGGTGTLYAMRESRDYRGFASAVAFYPGCRTICEFPPALPAVRSAPRALRGGGRLDAGRAVRSTRGRGKGARRPNDHRDLPRRASQL